MSGLSQENNEQIMKISNSLRSSFKKLETLRSEFPLEYRDQINQEVDDYTNNLMSKFGIKGYNSYFSLLTTNAYPYLNTKQQILTNNGIAVLWLLDDCVDDVDDPEFDNTSKKTEFCKEILRYLRGTHPVSSYSDNKFIRLLESDEFWMGYRNSPIAERYLQKLIEMIEYGMLVKLDYGEKQLDLESYLRMRYYDCGCECCWVFMDFDNEVPECDITRLGNFIIWAVNDMYSYWKDVLRDGTYYNYLCCKQQLTGFDFICDQLTDKITNSWHKLSEPFSVIEAQKELSLPNKVDIWARANLIWHEGCPRYWKPQMA